MTIPDCVRPRKAARSKAARRAARGGASNARQCKARLATPESPPLPLKLPAVAPTETTETSPPRTRCRGEGALQLPGVLAESEAPQVLPAERKQRSVSFDLEAGSEHEVTPYAEIYGLHPSEFMFERNGFIMLVTDGDFSDEDEGDSEDDEEDDEYMEDCWVMVHCS